MEFLGENFFEKKFSPNPFQKAFIWERDLVLFEFIVFRCGYCHAGIIVFCEGDFLCLI